MKLCRLDFEICKALTAKMERRPLCEPFLKPSEGHGDRGDGALCLEKVKHRLSTNTYHNVSGWISDVESIWLNALAHNPEGSALWLIADDVLHWFRKKLASTGWNGPDSKFIELVKSAKHMSDLAGRPPKSLS
jgi:hypothetical protein